ncbi:MAG: sugar ABC transporter substrate-binding protein [Burkholderiales bacterium PBB5]|nr:MAG: sugar ABC transporter substrate-binding protein [Burkholderiales bacterium PBB5]
MSAAFLPRRTVLAAGLASGLPLRAARARVLTVAAFPLMDKIVEAAQPQWQQMHPDVELKVLSRPYADHHTAMTTALSTAVYLPDVMALEQSFVGRFAQGTGLDDLSRAPFDIGRHRAHYAPYAYDQATTRSGAVVAAPADIGPGTLLYRTDLLAKAGVRPGEGLYFDKDSRVLVNTPRFHRAFEVARKVRQHQLDARVGEWTNDWAEGFKRGTLATEMSGAWLVGQLNNWVAPATKGLWRASQLPEGAFAAYGGAFYAVPRHSAPENKALAWDFIRLMTLDRARQFAAFKSQDAFPALVDCYDDPFFDEPLPFLGGQPARLLWREAAKRIVAMPVHKQTTFADEVITTELDHVLDRGKPIPQALADAERLIARRAFR